MTTAKSNMERIAREFWANTKSEFRYNYDIVKVVETSLNVQLIRIPQLCPLKINSWLSTQNMDFHLKNTEQLLKGALVIQNGIVLMFIDTNENTTWQRYTLAHQVSRFLLEYQLPGERAILRFGKEIASVLRGKEHTPVAQLVDSSFKETANNVYILLIEKNGTIVASAANQFHKNDTADMLALELLAPRYQILHETASKTLLFSYAPFRRKCRELLIGKYGIPLEIAHKYAAELTGSVMKRPFYLSRLGA